MDFTIDERDLILAGLFELTITFAEAEEKRERCTALTAKLGGFEGPAASSFSQERMQPGTPIGECSPKSPHFGSDADVCPPLAEVDQTQVHRAVQLTSRGGRRDLRHTRRGLLPHSARLHWAP